MVIYLLVTKFLTVSEEQNFLLDSIVDLLLTQKLTNLKVLQLQSDYFHDKVIICSSNSVIQMNSVIKKIKKDLKISEFIYEGENSNWLLISLKGLLIQIFTEESREYYNIEDIYFDSETLYHYG
jgi:ribosome-associated protein|tara:strand:- start:39 stop:410 length:372 start_codon:yes stop_codon:yes gene_type:complete